MKRIIGFIGAGQIGQALARHFVNAGHSVLLSNSRGKHSLEDLAEQLGTNAKAVDVAEAITADIIVLTVPWSKLETAVKGISDWNNKIVIDTTNNILSVSPSLQLANLNGKTTGEVVAGLLPDARVVKAFNTLYYKVLSTPPQETTGNRVIVLSGDNQEAKSTVAEIISSIGFAPLDLGSLKDGGKLQDVGGALSSIDLVKKNNNAQQAKEVVLRGITEIQSKGNFEIFEEVFAPDFIDHTPQVGGFKADRESVKNLYQMLRNAFPDLHADVHWQTIDGERVTTYKTYHGTHHGEIFGVKATGKKIHFESVDVMQVHNGQITDHWGAGNLLSLFQQLGGVTEIKN
jgi:steroid delta-isomerase-like uncharacterized protein